MKNKLMRSMQKFLNMYECAECGRRWGAFVSKYTRCANCSSEMYFEIGFEFEPPTPLEFPEGPRSSKEEDPDLS